MYEEIDACLIKAFPDYEIDEFDEGLPYCVAGGFALYLLEAFKNSKTSTLFAAGEFIELLHTNAEHKVRELATVGYLEGIQNVWGNNSVDPEEMVPYLGPLSKKWWDKLNRFWSGDVYALRKED
jgi:hypothetical protein